VSRKLCRATHAHRVAAYVVLGGMALGRAAYASPLFDLTGGVQGQGGLNARMVQGGAASAYFNPAFLAGAEQGFELGLLVLSDEIGIRVAARPVGADIPVAAAGAQFPNDPLPHNGVPTQWLEQGSKEPLIAARPRQAAGSGHNLRTYQVLGLVHKFFEGRLGLGIYGLIPHGTFTTASAFYSDEREQYFSNSLHSELYSDRLTATSLAFATGLQVTEALSIGISATLALKATAASPTYLKSIGRFQDILISSNVAVNTALAPHFGAVYRPTERWHVSATVHTPQQFEVEAKFKFLVVTGENNGVDEGAGVTFIHDYLPWKISAGSSYDIVRTNETSVAVVGGVTYARWSAYVDRHNQRPAGPYAWYDTLGGSAGVRYQRGPLRGLFDGVYEPSPVPDQTGRTNYVDNDRLGAGLGFDYAFQFLGGKLRAGIQTQVHRFLPRRTHKLAAYSTGMTRPDLVIDEVPDDATAGIDPVTGIARALEGREGLQTNNPGWPGFFSAGWITGGSLHVTLNY
jgi:long-chain fatty acid transport protein